MKQKLGRRIEAAAARLKSAGKKAMRHPVASILSLCMLAGLTATIVTYSQPADTTGRATISLPVERAITVLEVVPSSIEFNFANGSQRTMLISRVPEKDRARVEEAQTLLVYRHCRPTHPHHAHQ